MDALDGRAYRSYGSVGSGPADDAGEPWEGLSLGGDFGIHSERLGETAEMDGDFDGDGLADARSPARATRSPIGRSVVRLVHGAPRR